MINPILIKLVGDIKAGLAEIGIKTDALAALIPEVADPPPPPPPPPPSGTVPAVIVNPPALLPHLTTWTSGNATYVQPQAVENADGSYTLYTVFTDKNGHTSVALPGDVELRYIVDGKRLGKATAAASVFKQDGSYKLHAALVIPRPIDGVHWISVRLISGNTSLMSVEGQVFTVGTASSLGRYALPSFGGASLSGRYRKNLPDYVTWPGGDVRPPLNGKPRTVPLPMGLTASGDDPSLGLNISFYWMEPFNQFSQGLYNSQPDYFRSASGWVIARNWAWHAEHNATYATLSERRKPEYNGERLANGIDAYSMGDFGDKVLWLVSLRGTLSRTYLETGNKEAVAGRVYKEDTIALDPHDDRITQAQIDAANYTTLGNAVDPDHLLWDGPHTVQACPWNPDNEAILCDSFKHRFFHVDASVAPAKVTRILGTTKGREAGSIATAKINRPYAHVVYPDRRIVFCCTPKAGEEADGAVFELSSDWQTLREVAGPDKVTRPFWLCEFEPGYVLVWEHATGQIKKVHVETGATSFWAFGSQLPDGWGVLACDVNGTIGPKYDVFLAPGQSSGNVSIYRYDRNGVRRPTEFLKQSIGNAPQGSAYNALEPHGHYPWMLVLHRLYALGVVQGWGELAPRFFRRMLPTDSTAVYEHGAFNTGQGMFDSGTLPGFPYTLRPHGNALRSRAGHSSFGNLPGLQHLLAEKSDAEVMEYWRQGAGGSVPRPEFQGAWADQFMYWARWHDDNLPNALKPPKKPNALAPKITAWSASRSGDDVTVTFTTDKPTWGCLCDFRDAVPANGYATAHSLTLRDCGPSFAVRLADLDGNVIQTANVAG